MSDDEGSFSPDSPRSPPWHEHYTPTWAYSCSNTPCSQKAASGSGEEGDRLVKTGSEEGRRPGKRRLSLALSRAETRWSKLRHEAKRVGRQLATERRWRHLRKLQPVLRSKQFDQVICAAVLLNSLCMAIEVDVVPGEGVEPLLRVASHCFVVFFMGEALLKAAVFGKRIFASRAYLFELTLALFGVADLYFIDFRVIGTTDADIGLNVLPLLRMIHFAKLFRHGELALIAKCLVPAIGTMIYVTVFLFFIVFVFSIPLVRLVGQSELWEDEPRITKLYGSVPRAIFALLQMAINPDTDIMQVLFEKQGWTAPFFLVFVGMTTYIIMSIMVGAVTDNYKGFSESERERQGHVEHLRHEAIRQNLLNTLRKADMAEAGPQGALSLREFTKQLQSRGFQEALHTLSVDRSTCLELLELLEVEGHVYYEEFIQALSLIGKGAQATHVLWLRAHITEDSKRMEKRIEGVENQVAGLTKRFEDFEQGLLTRLDQLIHPAKTS